MEAESPGLGAHIQAGDAVSEAKYTDSHKVPASDPPAHALPWGMVDDVGDRQHVHVCSWPRAATVALCEEYDDALFIVRAGNAYPRLVEFVKQFAELMGPDSHIRADAEAFLRELGERQRDG